MNVKEFIEKASKIEGVKVFNDDERNEFIQKYIQKIESLNKTLSIRNSNLPENERIELLETDYIEETLRRNIKYVINVTFSDDELKVSNYDTDNPSLQSKNEKKKIGALPGQYIQGRVVYSNWSNNILVDHETTHAATINIFDMSGNIVIPNFDDMNATISYYEYIQQLENAVIVGGYSSNIIKNGQVIEANCDDEYANLMETCTESFAGMLNEKSEKDFEKFSIPTSNMSAIEYNRKMRNMLIMSIGSDAFIIDMLREDKQAGIDKLDNLIQKYSSDVTLIDFLKISGAYALEKGRIERGKYNDDLSLLQQKQKIMGESLATMEEMCTKIFLKRMETSADIDKNEQIEYFSQMLETEKSQTLLGKIVTNKRNNNEIITMKLVVSNAITNGIGTEQVQEADNVERVETKEKQIEGVTRDD